MEPHDRTPGWLSKWDLVPLAAVLLVACALPVLLSRLPDPIPTHFDLRGRPDGWTSKAAFPWLLFGLPGGLWLILLFSGWAFAGSDQDPDGRKGAAMAPMRGFTASGVMVLLLAVVLRPGSLALGFGIFAAFLLLGMILMVRELKRLGAPGPSDDYRWGLFYVNPDDPKVWVPKRFGIGWTLNYAHASAWWLTLLLLAPVLGLLLVQVLIRR
ncbi:DUF5808 domain-containing protein [Geothrix sp. 21YS21S-4]|uniref:DUF5808 domain-containing protein n=1 Tax=Geothrix sp. 21YS21S-4 TaxID=3068889 RepID=UPI0027BA33B0|nr:DUF5808 domain-containing protein [Geothrix sp. 21YS21S-4]